MNGLYSRISIGTASWGKTYRGKQVPEDEIVKILNWCRTKGITHIDAATAYDVGDIISKHTKDFYIQCKVQPGFMFPEWADYCISHTSRVVGGGCSLNFGENPDSTALYTIQVPYSIVDRRFEEKMSEWHENFDESERIEIQVRSVFCAGRVFDHPAPEFQRVRDCAHSHGLTTGGLCILFCLLNKNIDRVIVGVDSLEQLQADLHWIDELDILKIDNDTLIETRNF